MKNNNDLEKMLKNELGLRRWVKVVIVFGLALVFTLSIQFCIHVYSITSGIVRGQAVRSITNISQLNEESITRALESRQLLLKTIAARLERENFDDVNAILREMQDFAVTYDFANMGIMDRDRTLYMLSGVDENMTDTDFAELVWDDQCHLTKSYPPYDGSKYMVNAFSAPIHRDGELRYVLLATYYSKNLTERMNISSMEGRGYTFLLDIQGEVVIYPQHYEDAEYNALMKYINDTPSIIPLTGGDQFFDYDGERYYANFEELGMNGWFLMTCARETDVFADASALMKLVFLAVGVLWGLIFIAVCGTFFSMRYSRQNRIQTTFYDELLGIGNGNALSVCYKNLPEQVLSGMYLVAFDIDKFKEFNYIYGNINGDRLLQYLVRVVQEEFPQAYLFRYVSDVFVALHPYEEQETFERRLQHLDERVDEDVTKGIIQPFEVSAGVRKLQAREPIRLAISDALIARETIKGNYLRHYVFYDGTIRDRRVNYMEMETNFPIALQNREFRVYYQPKCDIRTGEIVGAEALARWVREDGTVISPGEFIPCLEESYQIILLDEMILTEVCRQMKEMQSDGLEIKPVSVNLSRIHLRQPDILPKIASIIRESEIEPANLSFEITESALLEDTIPMKAILNYLHELGCRVEMDDYGVGASNPDSLLSNNFDMLKLDKSFVDRIGNERAEDLIRSTAHLAMKWGMGVLAEGVEELHQAERLVELGCSYAQGFYYSKPIPEEDYRELLRSAAKGEKSAPEVPMSARCFSEDISTLLDSNLLPTYVIDPERFIVMYCNLAMRSYIGEEDPTGGLCYQKLRGKDAPCEGCSAMRLYRDGDNSPKEIEIPLGGWALLQTSPLHWQGREFIQITCVDITRQKQMEEELHLRSREYEVIVQQSVTGVMRYDIGTDTATVNVDRNLDRVEEYRISNYVQKMIESGLIMPDSVSEAKTMLDHVRNGLPSRGYDIQLSLERDGLRWCHFDYALIKDAEGKPYRAVVSFRDNTKQREKELAYESWNSSLSALINEHTVYVAINLSKDVVESENRFGTWIQESNGQCYSSLMGRVGNEWVVPTNIREFQSFFNREQLLGRFYAGQRESSLEYQVVMEGRPQWFRAELQMASDPSGNDVKASFVFKNVDTEVQERERLKYEAERDSMTGLYNRATTERLIREMLEQHTGEHCCLMIIDLDDLRDINNSFGHLEGDRALKCIANAMRTKFRKGDILGRMGGDEFAVFLHSVPKAEGLRASVSDFMNRLRGIKIGPLNDRAIHVSVGGATGTAGKIDFKTLYGQADLALYYTKMAGKNSFNFYVPEMESKEFLYQPHSTVTMTRTDWYESAEFRKLLRGMAAFFPLVISVNLTKNTYYMMEYMAYTTQRAKDEGSFDELIADGAATFYPEDQAGFLECFQREKLLEAYAAGKRLVAHMGRQLGEDGVYRMVHTVVVFVEDDITNDICEITFSHVMSEKESSNISFPREEGEEK